MKKTIKRTLALLLAGILAFGFGTAAFAAEGVEGTVTVVTQPTDTTFDMYEEEPNLSGMVISVSGGIFTTPTTIRYDDVADDTAQGPDKLIWYFGAYNSNWDYWWDEGSNEATLYVTAYKCTEFHLERTINGVDFGIFDEELVFEAETTITVTAKPYGDGPADAQTLTVDVPAPVNISADEGGVWFKFTAPQAGYYKFASEGGQYEELLYSRDGSQVLDLEYVDPYASLYGVDFEWFGSADDNGGNLNFVLFKQMEKNEVVFLYTSCYLEEDPVEYTVTATRLGDTKPVLKLTANKLETNVREIIDFDSLLKGTGFTTRDMDVEYDSEYFDSDCRGFFSNKRGVSTVALTAPDGSSADVEVTIKYSPEQWACVIFLGGWAWMKYAPPGPFSLQQCINELLDYGVGNGLFDLLRDWGLPYWMISWLRW